MTMSNATKANDNGTPRKNLASQLDRLDGIIDALADGLNEAVASAVEQAVGLAVKEAVRATLAEALANPALREALRGNAAPAPAPAPAPARRGWLGRLGDWVGDKLRSAARACAAGLEKVRQVAVTVWNATGGAATAVLVAAAVGAAAGAVRVAGSRLADIASGAWGWMSGLASRAVDVLRPARPAAAFGT
jgi:hypothetical protein